MRKRESTGGLTPLDVNPIENIWHELKECIRRDMKPTSKAELIVGIKAFWETVKKKNCQKYIDHLKKVIPAVVECKGAATGY